MKLLMNSFLLLEGQIVFICTALGLTGKDPFGLFLWKL